MPQNRLNMKKLPLVFCISHLFCFSQPVIEWQRNFGGTNYDETPTCHPTFDGGGVIAGAAGSNDGDISGNHGLYDVWVAKLDVLGNISWQNCLGGSQSEDISEILLTSDGGYLVVANSVSNDGDVTGNHGFYDYWIVKLDNVGNIQWQKSIGGSADDYVKSAQNTPDGGFILAGYTFSNDGDVSGNNGGFDCWIVKLDGNGNLQWQNTFGGTSYDYAESIQLTQDGGFVFAGNSLSSDVDLTSNQGNYDYWVVKLDQLGNIQWQKSLGGTADDLGKSIISCSDGGYLLVGDSQSNDGDASGNHGDYDCWVVKLDASGNLVWQKPMGGSSADYAADVTQNANGSCQFVGYTDSNDGDISSSISLGDIWLVNFDLTGNIIWEKTFGGLLLDNGTSYRESYLDGAFLVGFTTSDDHDVCNNNGFQDFWIVKLNDCTSPLPTNPLEICSVGLDSLTNKNRIVWEKPLDVGIDSFYVYKEIAAGVYSKIGAVDNCENGVFIDMNSVPMDSSYKYKVAVLGMCGDTSALSNTAHQTVKLTVTPGTGVFDLAWNSYEGYPFTTYNLYRGSDPSNITQIATLPSSVTTYQDIAPPVGALFYQIEVVNPNDCDPTKINGYGVSRSNIASNGIASTEDVMSEMISVYPNPTKGNMTLEVGDAFIGKGYKVMDGYGRTLFIGTIQTAKQPLEMNRLSKGTYFLNIESTGSVQRLIKW
jgi:hypothetical protein